MKRNPADSGVRLTSGSESLTSSTGAVTLLQAVAVSRVGKELSARLRPWRAGRAVHDPAKTVLDLAIAIALGGDCVADVAVVRAQPELFGPVASDPTISRLIDRLGADPENAVAAIRAARAAARDRVWGHRSPVSPTGQVVVDLDATLVSAIS